MAADYSRIHRLLRIITLIQRAKGWTPQRLASELGVDVRTIYRDMKMLGGAEIPYFYDDVEKCYQIRGDFFLPPVQLTFDEAMTLSVLATHIGNGEHVPLLRSASMANAKIRAHLPPAIRSELERVEDHVAMKLAATSAPESIEHVYDIVRAALARRQSLSCTYESASSDGSSKSAKPFLFNPYTLFFNQRTWYVVGHHGGHREVRSLRLSRFTQIKKTDETYSIPKTFSLDKHLGHAWRMMKGSPRYDVELFFDKTFADTIGDTRWHATQDVIWHDDGAITFTCSVDGLDEIVWWILSMGPHCRVVKPKELAQRVKTLARETSDLYSNEKDRA